jgi:putative transposase
MWDPASAGFDGFPRFRTRPSACSFHCMFRPHPQHLQNFAYIGKYRYSLRFGTRDRAPVFNDPNRVMLVLAQIVRAASETEIAIVAYCFMPDHLHLLVEGQTESSDCKRFIARAKQYSGFYYSREFGQQLWQRYGFERVLREDEPTEVVARYIVENPIRAGLVQRVDECAYVGSFAYDLDALISSVQCF